MNKSFENGVQVAWDSTSLNLAQTCLRKYQYVMMEGWQPRDKSVHLLFGGWFASAVELFHKRRAEKVSYEDALAEVTQTAMAWTWEYQLPDGQWVFEEQVPKDIQVLAPGRPWTPDYPGAKNRETLIRTIIWYLEHYKDDPLETMVLQDGKPAVELSFQFNLTDDLVYCGHIDRLVNYNGEVYVQDQKTTGTTLSPRFFEAFNPDVQMSGYTFAGQIIFNAPVKGVVIDAAQIAVGFTRFERGFTFRTQPQLEEWRANAIYHIETAQAAARANFFPMNTASCGNYGSCQFRAVCGRHPQVREQFLKADFVRGPSWDPLTPR
jgi:hypothetical protein